jgi:DHA2 family multidrug resistance protein-like MFS transporter
VVGPILGGLLLDQFWWGSVFLLAVPVMALLLIAGPRILPEYRDPAAGRLDLVSVALSLVAILGIIFGLKTIAQDGIGLAPAASMGVGLSVGALWVRRQLLAADPMFDLRLFRITRFTTSLAINFLAIFLAIGYFLFVAQYMQLVLGLSPLEAALWSLPEAVAFIIGPNIAPRIVRRVRPAYLLAGGFLIAGVGLAILGSITASSPNGLALVVIGSTVISIGLGPVFGLTTELIVGSAPPERAGAATGMSETGSEVGGALGLSILGTIGLAIYRSRMTSDLPAGVPGDAAAAARDTLGAAIEVAAALPAELGGAVARVAQDAFVDGMQVAAFISVALSLVVAVVAFLGLRHVPPTSAQPLGSEPAPEPAAQPRAGSGPPRPAPESPA